MRQLAGISLALLLATAGALRAGDATGATGFEGVWRGEIAGPDARAKFGVAFTPTPRGELVSVGFPAMFLFSTNFGEAAIEGDTFRLAPLQLELRRNGDRLTGTLGPAALAVELRRDPAGSFAAEPAPVEPPPGPQPLWMVSLGAAAWGSPIVAERVVYVGTADGRMHAIGADGREVWHWSGPNPLYGTVAVTPDALYFVDAASELVALDRVAGRLRWRTPLRRPGAAGGALRDDPTQNHRTPTPVIDPKGVLYVGSDDGALCAIRARSGKVLWRVELNTPVYADVALDGDDLWVGGFDGSLVRLNRRTHKLLLSTKVGGAIVSAPVVAGNRVVVGARDALIHGLDAATGRPAWRDTYWFSWVESTPRFADNLLYFGSSDFRRVSAVEPATGAVKWAADVRGLTWGTPLVVGDTVFAATAGLRPGSAVIEHRTGIVAIDRSTGTAKWRHELPTSETAPLSGITGSLALLDDTIVGVTVDGVVIALPARR